MQLKAGSRTRILGQALLACALFQPVPPALGQSAPGCQNLPARFTEWTQAVNLGPVVNSASSDQWPALSPDGLSLYFVSGRPGGVGAQDLWVTQRASQKAPWGPPMNLGPTINSTTRDNSPFISPDGHWLIFGSRRAVGRCRTDSTNEFFISYREDVHDDFAWSPPVNFGCEISGEGENAGLTFFEDHSQGITTLYFSSSRPGGPGAWEIHASTRLYNGGFQAPALVLELSSPREDGALTVRRDGLEMILTYDAGAVLVDGDLWTSTRASATSPWSPPVKLGPEINSAADENFPSLSLDGTTLIFASNRPGGAGSTDLYMSTRRRIPDAPACSPFPSQQ